MTTSRYKNVDSKVAFLEQLKATEEGPVVLLNTFTVDEADINAMLDAWQEDASIMKRQPGFISAQLHQGIGGANVFVNYAIFESLDAYRRAYADPEFQKAITKAPSSAVIKPVLLKKIAVQGICVA